MEKIDKKIVSMLLVLMIFISQFAIVFATDYATGEEVKTLTDYLIENGVDADGDGILSDAEWAKVHELVLDEKIDITGIEKAVNLKCLSIYDNISSIDFPKMDNLEMLCIYNCTGNINMSKLVNLKSLSLFTENLKEISFPKFNNLEFLDMELTFGEKGKFCELDLENCEHLESARLVTNGDLNFKLHDNIVVTDYGLEGISESQYIYKGYSIDYIADYLFPGCKIEFESNDIIELKGDSEIYGKNIGTKDVTITDVLGRKKTMQIVVYETPIPQISTELENNSIVAEIIDESMILKSNGELWKVNSETTVEKIDTNVKDYVSDLVYTNDMYNGFDIENTLKKDNTLIVKYNDVEKEISNVISMTPSMYVNTAGELYELNINYITEEMKPTKILEGAKRVYMHYETKYIEMNDGTTYRVLDGWRNNTANNDYEEYTFPPKVDGGVCGYFLICDEDSDERWVHTIKKDSEYGWEHNEDYIINYVADINHSSNYYTDILLREDGSIWTYSEQYGLTKITKSTPLKEEEKPPVIEEDEYIKNPTIKDKEVGGSTAISGIGGNKTVESLINGNNFNEEYTIKVFDSNNQEVASTKVLGTGLKVKLYKDNNEVQEYVILIYGDVSGDGTINAFDALTLIKGINNKVPFKGEIYKEAGRIITGSGQAPTALDALAIVKSANNKYTINQSK